MNIRAVEIACLGGPDKIFGCTCGPTSFEVLIKNGITHKTCFIQMDYNYSNRKLTLNFFGHSSLAEMCFIQMDYNYSQELNINTHSTQSNYRDIRNCLNMIINYNQLYKKLYPKFLGATGNPMCQFSLLNY